jgi:hypothetical protein
MPGYIGWPIDSLESIIGLFKKLKFRALNFNPRKEVFMEEITEEES